ncbi:MAG: sigma-70 family RNA polymerase sigma factor [Oscillospiraceae bacterium]|nr:sigma-70 family RNA polymerase sigma factor [Oscillospiraceae bacterium]
MTADSLEFDPEIVRRLARSTDERIFAEKKPEERLMILHLVREVWDTELTDCQRRYLLCYYQKAMTMRVIAAAFGVTVPTVSRTMKRARIRLRRVLNYYIKSA